MCSEASLGSGSSTYTTTDCLWCRRGVWICCLAWRRVKAAVCVSSTSLIFRPSAQVLNLSNNNISRIEGGALAPLHSLAILALEGNNLHHLKFKTFVSLQTTATHITLSGFKKSSVLNTKFGSSAQKQWLHIFLLLSNFPWCQSKK